MSSAAISRCNLRYFGRCTSELSLASESYLVSAQVADMIAAIVVCSLPNQFAREAILNLLALKATFIRYVSHEIRSPLNVAIAGLEVMEKDVALLNLSPDFVETFNDVSSSAATAVDILDDCCTMKTWTLARLMCSSRRNRCLKHLEIT